MEGAVVMSALLLILFFLFDVGLAVVRYNLLSTAARSVARQAIVRGSLAAPELTEWGTTAISGTVADTGEIGAVAIPYLATMSPGDVSCNVQWPDGDNASGNRVQVRLNYVHTPLVPMLGLGGAFQLRAQSTMNIVH